VKYPVLMLAAIALIAATPAPPTPPPTPPPLTDTQASPLPASAASPDAVPAVTPTPSLDSILGAPVGAKAKPGAKPTPTPPPPRKGLDGVWEVQIQRGPKTEYEHMNLIQTGQSVAGIFLTKENKKFPVTGSLDQQNNIRLVISLPDGSTILLEARVDGTTDMLGMFTDAAERVPFTAAYRPKEKWIENINATPGGLGGGSGGPP
jgi:hypothetical protein